MGNPAWIGNGGNEQDPRRPWAQYYEDRAAADESERQERRRGWLRRYAAGASLLATLPPWRREETV